jgi:RimJ/RimL family protein N-acetyltransferase
METHAPAEPLPIAPGAVLRPFRPSDAGELTAAIAANREHLARWLPWAETHAFEDSVEYLDRKRAQIEANDGFEGAIVLDGRIVGGAGFHGVDWINRSSSIGYRQEALLREAKLIRGRYEDAVLYAMLASEWSPPAPAEATGNA